MLTLCICTCSGDDTMSSSGSSQPSYSPQPPSETSAPPPYSSPSGAPDRMISPDNTINSLLDENLPKGGKKDAERIPFPGGGPATYGNTKLPRYSQIEVLSPTGNGSVENPPAYPGNSAEFVQPPAPNSALQTVCLLTSVCVCLCVCGRMVMCLCVYLYVLYTAIFGSRHFCVYELLELLYCLDVGWPATSSSTLGCFDWDRPRQYRCEPHSFVLVHTN